jgi:aspartate/methionine/tyrosine aminotransferase
MTAIEEALAEAPRGEPALAIVNAPSNPGGYSPTASERQALVASLLRVAASRPLLVVCDDAYAGLVFEPDVPSASLFWDLVERHPNLAPVKVDGATKEFGLFGGRVGFLTFPFDPDSPAALALESKVKCLSRATVGSPVSIGQRLLLRALDSGEAEGQVEAVRRVLERRYRALTAALADLDRELLTPLPFNSGCFALVELRAETGLDAETVRLHLLGHHEVGLISIAPRFLRIAFCSVDEEALPELVRRLELGVRSLASG